MASDKEIWSFCKMLRGECFHCPAGLPADFHIDRHADGPESRVSCRKSAEAQASLVEEIQSNVPGFSSFHKPLYANEDCDIETMVPGDPNRCAAEKVVDRKTWPNGGPQCSMKRSCGPENAFCGNHARVIRRNCND